MAIAGANQVAADITIGPTQIWLAAAVAAVPTLTSSGANFDATFDSPGYTKDGVQVVYTPTISGIPVDEELSDVVKYLSAEKLEIKFKLAQATLVNLNYGIAAGTVETLGSDTRLSIGSGLQSALKYWSFGCVGPAPSSGSRIFYAYKTLSVGAITEHRTSRGAIEYDITLEALPDTSLAQAVGKRLAFWQDFPAGVTS